MKHLKAGMAPISRDPGILYLEVSCVLCRKKSLAIGAGSTSSKLPKLAEDKFTSLHRSQSQRQSQTANGSQQIWMSH